MPQGMQACRPPDHRIPYEDAWQLHRRQERGAHCVAWLTTKSASWEATPRMAPPTVQIRHPSPAHARPGSSAFDKHHHVQPASWASMAALAARMRRAPALASPKTCHTTHAGTRCSHTQHTTCPLPACILRLLPILGSRPGHGPGRPSGAGAVLTCQDTRARASPATRFSASRTAPRISAMSSGGQRASRSARCRSENACETESECRPP